MRLAADLSYPEATCKLLAPNLELHSMLVPEEGSDVPSFRVQ